MAVLFINDVILLIVSRRCRRMLRSLRGKLVSRLLTIDTLLSRRVELLLLLLLRLLATEAVYSYCPR